MSESCASPRYGYGIVVALSSEIVSVRLASKDLDDTKNVHASKQACRHLEDEVAVGDTLQFSYKYEPVTGKYHAIQVWYSLEYGSLLEQLDDVSQQAIIYLDTLLQERDTATAEEIMYCIQYAPRHIQQGVGTTKSSVEDFIEKHSLYFKTCKRGTISFTSDEEYSSVLFLLKLVDEKRDPISARRLAHKIRAMDKECMHEIIGTSAKHIVGFAKRFPSVFRVFKNNRLTSVTSSRKRPPESISNNTVEVSSKIKTSGNETLSQNQLPHKRVCLNGSPQKKCCLANNVEDSEYHSHNMCPNTTQSLLSVTTGEDSLPIVEHTYTVNNSDGDLPKTCEIEKKSKCEDNVSNLRAYDVDFIEPNNQELEKIVEFGVREKCYLGTSQTPEIDTGTDTAVQSKDGQSHTVKNIHDDLENALSHNHAAEDDVEDNDDKGASTSHQKGHERTSLCTQDSQASNEGSKYDDDLL